MSKRMRLSLIALSVCIITTKISVAYNQKHLFLMHLWNRWDSADLGWAGFLSAGWALVWSKGVYCGVQA